MEHEREPSSSPQKSSTPQSLLYILLSAFGFWLGWFLSKLHAPLQDSNDSVFKQNDTAKKRGICENLSHSPMRVVVDRIPPPDTPPENKAAEERKEKREEWGLRLQWLTLAALVIYTGVTLGLFLATQDANKIAQKALYQGHRPWVGLDGGIQFPEPLTFEIYPTTRNMRLGVSYFIKNYGSAPALRTASFAETFVEKGPLKRPEMPMRMACLNADGPKDLPGSTVIFPGQSIRASSYITTNFDPTMHTIGQIWITICTSYTDDTGKLRHTKTWAITVPPKGDQPIPVKPGDQLLYYPRFEAQVYYEETDQ